MFPCSPSLFPYTTLFRSFAFLLLLDMLFYRGQDLSIERAIVLFCYLSYLFQQMSRKPNSKRFYVVFHVVILTLIWLRSEEHTLNSSHRCISYAVFCLKKK